MGSLFSDTPLGRKTDYIDTYTPSLLCPVPRWDGREELDIGMDLPFHGMDIWNAYEISWLDKRGKPVVAMAEFMMPCSTRNLIESKSLKLYLNSFSGSRFDSRLVLKQTMEDDLSSCAEGAVEVRIKTLGEAAEQPLWDPPGSCVDHLDVTIEEYEHNPELLVIDQGPERTETYYSHLLRSCCPVTNQPDWATVVIHYTGAPISAAGLLRYIVSFRNHAGFHEQVIEQMFMDIKRQCEPRQLTVHGLFTRRGGLDINPFRSDFENPPAIRRVIRQ